MKNARARQRRFPTPTGKGMSNLKGTKNRYWRKRFWLLPPDKQESIKAMANRYFSACESFGAETDPDFFKEVIMDVTTGVYQ